MLVDCLDVDVKHVMDTATEGQERLRGKAAAAMEEDRQQLIDMANKLGRDMEALATFVEKLSVLAEKATTNVVMSISADQSEVPERLKGITEQI